MYHHPTPWLSPRTQNHIGTDSLKRDWSEVPRVSYSPGTGLAQDPTVRQHLKQQKSGLGNRSPELPPHPHPSLTTPWLPVGAPQYREHPCPPARVNKPKTGPPLLSSSSTTDPNHQQPARCLRQDLNPGLLGPVQVGRPGRGPSAKGEAATPGSGAIPACSRAFPRGTVGVGPEP